MDLAIPLTCLFDSRNGGKKPEKIIYFRDGVSEGQFEEVMNCEMSAIQRACKRMSGGDYEPGITFVVVQVRNHQGLHTSPLEGLL
jgi:eukaryotic translation initiation factor 2C